MQRMEMLLSKTPATDVKSDVLPMIYRALESDTAQIQELCLSIIPGFAGMYQLGFVSAWQFLALVVMANFILACQHSSNKLLSRKDILAEYIPSPYARVNFRGQ